MDLPPRKYHRFGSFCHEPGPVLEMHQLRDGAAFTEVSVILQERGYTFGELLLNYPPPKKKHPDLPFRLKDAPERKDIDLTGLRLSPADFLIVSTRPEVPLKDGKTDPSPMKYIDSGQNTLEDQILEKMRRHFEKCLRDHVILAEMHVNHFKRKDKKDRADIQFYQERVLQTDEAYKNHNGAWYKRFRYPNTKRGKRIHEARTAAYLLYEAEAWTGGPGLIISFGLSGAITLIWNYILRMKHEDLFEKPIFTEPVFILAELSKCYDYPDRPLHLGFAENWDVEILLEHYFTGTSS